MNHAAQTKSKLKKKEKTWQWTEWTVNRFDTRKDATKYIFDNVLQLNVNVSVCVHNIENWIESREEGKNNTQTMLDVEEHIVLRWLVESNFVVRQKFTENEKKIELN